MPHQRGDIVEINFGLPPKGKMLNHLAVVISSNDVYLDDDCYIVVMLTSQRYSDRYSFEITNEMLALPSNKLYSEARCHLVTFILPSHINNLSGYRNKVKRQYVDALVEHIVNSSFY